jgi:hypothetical protein
MAWAFGMNYTDFNSTLTTIFQAIFIILVVWSVVKIAFYLLRGRRKNRRDKSK